MSGSSLTWMLLIWGIITGVFVVLMIYRALMSMKEDDQIFLDPAESKLEAEQHEIMARINRVTPYAKGFGFASAGLLLLMGGLWLYRGFTGLSAP